jgi:hypothetical protein
LPTKEKAYKLSYGKKQLERHRRRWKDNIKMDLKEVGCQNVDWVHLAQDRS